MLLYEAADVCRTTYDPASRILVATWWRMEHAQLQPNLERQMEQVQAGARYLIIDVGDCVGAPTAAEQAWFVGTVFPSYRAGGLVALINVVPKSGVARLGASRWQRSASRFGFDTFDTSDVQTALDLLAEKYGVRATLEAVTT